MSIQGPSSSGAALGMRMEAALLRKVRDVQEVQGQAAVKLIEQTDQQSELAKSAPHPRTTGSRLDIYA